MIRDIAGIVVGLAVGLLSATMGIGGGVLMVPAMVIGFGFKQHIAQGTSLVAIVPTSLVGAFTHSRYGNVLYRNAVLLGAGGSAGVVLGAILALHIPRQALTRLFGAFLIFSAYRTWARARKRQLDT